MSPEKLVRMANQIAVFMVSKSESQADGVAGHLNDYWEPRMRRQLLDHIAAGGDGLHPLVLEAAPLVRDPEGIR
jgi:formate dehydrogenase subunit delta